MTLGEKIAKQRKELNYTQEQLADILAVSRQSISKWESDIAYPETDKLVKMGKLFDCSMDYLLNEDITEKQDIKPKEIETFWDKIKKQFHERKSEKMVFGMPLYHIGRNAHGFFAIGGNIPYPPSRRKKQSLRRKARGCFPPLSYSTPR